MTYALWIVQGLLALIFLFTGGMKLVLPIEVMTEQMPVPLPGLFLRFIGVTEVLGAVGLILPGLLGIRPGLTPLATAGLVIIMIGAWSRWRAATSGRRWSRWWWGSSRRSSPGTAGRRPRPWPASSSADRIRRFGAVHTAQSRATCCW